MYEITDTAGTSGAVTVEAYDVADAIRPWYPEAPSEVADAIDELQDRLLRGQDTGAITEYLSVTITRID